MAEAFYRSDALSKVTGSAVYGVDLAVPGMLVGGLVRAPAACGRVIEIDTRQAEALAGVVVATAADFPVERFGMVVHDQPPLAADDVRYWAEPVVAVAAPDEATLARAVEAVTVTVERSRPLLDVEEALEPGAPLVHPDAGSYATSAGAERGGNVCGRSTLASGDTEGAFAAASAVIEERYVTPRVHQGYIEPRACLAVPEPDGGFHVHTSTQNPYGVRATLAKVLQLPPSRLRVSGAAIGGGFGGKLDVTLEHFACVLARKAGRPVKICSSRAEELASAFPRENSVVRIRSAVDGEGRITGREVTCLLDAGAYAHDTPFIAAVATLQAAGPYRIPAVTAEALAVYTNTQPTGAYRGPSGPQMVLAVESHTDALARRLGADPVAFRRRHLAREGDVAPNGQVLEGVSIERCLDAATELIGYGQPRPAGVGVGVACAWWTTTAGGAGVTVRLEPDGTVALVTAATEIGSGAVAAGVVSLVAQRIGLPPEAVRLASTADTATGAYDFGAQGSRTTFNVGNAAIAACDEVLAQIRTEAAALLEAAEQDLVVEDGAVHVAGSPGARVDLATVAAAALARSGPVHASSRYHAPATPYDPSCLDRYHAYPTFNSPSFHCHAAEVAVDGTTGFVSVLRYAVAQDVGRAIVPGAIEGQIQGGVLQGIGLALLEEERLEGGGQVANTDLEGYKLPTVMEAPDIAIALVEEPSRDGPLGAKGVGEPPIILPAAAIVNAVADATGCRIRELPLTPERVLAALDGGVRT